jgi:omega-amidase
MKTIADKAINIETANKFIREAAEHNPDLIILPEMWNTPYSIDQFRPFAEQIDGEFQTTPTLNFLKSISAELT